MAQSVSELSLGPTKAVTSWLTDQIAPAYWRPNSQILVCGRSPLGSRHRPLCLCHCAWYSAGSKREAQTFPLLELALGAWEGLNFRLLICFWTSFYILYFLCHGLYFCTYESQLILPRCQNSQLQNLEKGVFWGHSCLDPQFSRVLTTRNQFLPKHLQQETFYPSPFCIQGGIITRKRGVVGFFNLIF